MGLMSVDVIPPGQRRRIAVIGSGNKRMLSRGGLLLVLNSSSTRAFIAFFLDEGIDRGEEKEVKS